MRYNLGYLDQYSIEAVGTVLENIPMLKVRFKTPIDPILLENSVCQALKAYPLFSTKVMYDKEYYLTDNNNPIVIVHASLHERPLKFGKSTNDYPWQICYDNNEMTFEWLHGVTDGNGALVFIRMILLAYFGVDGPETKKVYRIAPGLEPFYDKNEEGEDFPHDPDGFSFKDFPLKKHKGFKADCHFLSASTAEIVGCARACESSVAPLLAVLFSRALKMHLPKNAKNRNVACNIAVDLRRPLGYETMHNCVELPRITYLDRHDTMSIKAVAKEYRQRLDTVRRIPNVVRMMTERVNMLKAIHLVKGKRAVKLVMKIGGILMQNHDCNFVVTYLGKVDLPKEVLEKVEDIQFELIPDFGGGALGCIDYNGKFNAEICETFAEKGVVEDFIELSRQIGIHWTVEDEHEFEQAHFVE